MRCLLALACVLFASSAMADEVVGVADPTVFSLLSDDEVLENPVDGAGEVESTPDDTPTLDPYESARRSKTVKRESRIFWYAAGASALTSLAVRVIAIIPGMFALGAAATVGAVVGPPALIAMLGAMAIGLVTVDAAVAALATTILFDAMSTHYSSRYFAVFGGQFAGNVITLGTLGLLAGYAGLAVNGAYTLEGYVGRDPGNVLLAFSIFGVMPAFVVVFLAAFIFPAAIGAWAAMVAARPREGYVVDKSWHPLQVLHRDAVPFDPREVVWSDRKLPALGPKLTIPGT